MKNSVTLATVAAAIVIAGCSSVQSPTAAAQNKTPAPEASFTAKFDQSPMQNGGPDSHGVVTYIVSSM